MERFIFLFAFITLSACKLEQINKQDKLLGNGLNGGGQINPPIGAPDQTPTWRTGNLSIYFIDADEGTFSGRYSYIHENSEVSIYGDFSFTEEEDFNYLNQNRALFETRNELSITIKLKLLQQGSSCLGSPNSEICATVITPDKYEISDIQALE